MTTAHKSQIQGDGFADAATLKRVHPPLAQSGTETMTSSYQHIAAILVRDFQLSRDQLALDAALVDLGIDSLNAVELLWTIGKARRGGEGRDMDAPFILASRARAGAVDDDFALAQGERPAVEQAAGA